MVSIHAPARGATAQCYTRGRRRAKFQFDARSASRAALISLCVAIWVLSGPVAWAGGVSVSGALTHEATLAPGAQTEGRIVVQNTTDKPREVRIYQTDYEFFADGTNNYGEPGTLPRSNAGWIVLTPPRLTVAPQSAATIYYTLQAPDDPALVGTYWSMIMVEPQPEDALIDPEAEPGKVKMAIRQVIRYGVQIVTNIGATGTSELKFPSKQLARDEETGAYTLLLDIENTGQRWLRPKVWVELYSAEGAQVGRFEGQQIRVYPGCSVRVRIEMAQLAAGTYQALVVADNGDDDVFGAQYQLEAK